MEKIFVNCYNCKSTENSFYASENGFNLVKCIACGLLFVNPRPNDKQITESHTMGMHHGDIIIDYIGSFSQSKVNRYNLILKDFFDNRTFGNNKKWLDIGCGFGELILSIIETEM